MRIGGFALGGAIGLVGFLDLAVRTYDPLPADYCRVSEMSASERPGLSAGDLTTHNADSGCMPDEEHLCGYQRIVLSEILEVRPQPC